MPTQSIKRFVPRKAYEVKSGDCVLVAGQPREVFDAAGNVIKYLDGSGEIRLLWVRGAEAVIECVEVW